MSTKHNWFNIKFYLELHTIYRDECWLYQIGDNGKGHCQIRLNDDLEYVHRISAALYLGYDLRDKTKQVNHKPKCPNKNCWNPEHLYIGTQTENMIDTIATGVRQKDICQRGHTIDGIRPDGRKYCKVCKIESQKKRRKNFQDSVFNAIESHNKKI